MNKKETTLFGIKDPSTCPPCKSVKIALGHATKYLDIYEFIDVISFEKDPIMTDFFGK
jgi:hypothetical protein